MLLAGSLDLYLPVWYLLTPPPHDIKHPNPLPPSTLPRTHNHHRARMASRRAAGARALATAAAPSSSSGLRSEAAPNSGGPVATVLASMRRRLEQRAATGKLRRLPDPVSACPWVGFEGRGRGRAGNGLDRGRDPPSVDTVQASKQGTD
jgi:hypothetical protein